MVNLRNEAQFRYALYDHALVGVAVLSASPCTRAVLTKPFPDFVPYVESTELSQLVLADRVLANGGKRAKSPLAPPDTS